jgi:hypothetical protein
VARGYLNSPDLTAAKFPARPSVSGSPLRLYRSGDLACWNPDGTLTFHGRLDDQIKVRGYRVEPEEIAAALLECPGIAQAAVTVVGSDSDSRHLVAYCVPESGCTITDSARLRVLLNDRLPDYMIPDAFVELARLPLNPNGKLDRGSLPAPSFSSHQTRIAPSSAVEHELSARWAAVLGHEEFGVTDNFFLMGGHSLSAVSLAAAIEACFGYRVSVSDIFRWPTIAEQASWVTRGPGDVDETAAADGAPAGNIVTLQPHGDLPPLYVLHGWQGAVNSHLAPVIGSRRPLLGLQGSGIEHDAHLPALSVAALADRYADQIIARTQPGMMIHLLGFSAAGWYAHAVADALLRRGATIGLFAVLDSGGTVRIHRGIGLLTLPMRVVPRLRGHLRRLISPPEGHSRLDYLRKCSVWLNRHVDSFLLHHRDVDRELREACAGGSNNVADVDSDFYIILHRTYRPRPLPIAVDVFGPADRIRFLKCLWGFYARGGVRCHPMFSEHNDFRNPDNAAELAAELTSAIAEIEARGRCRTARRRSRRRMPSG